MDVERSANGGGVATDISVDPDQDAPSSLADAAGPGEEPAERPVELAPTRHRGRRLLDRLAEANKELWLILSLLVIVALMNFLMTGQRMVLGLYTLPTVFSAYCYGRRHAALTALASIAVVVLVAHVNPALLGALKADSASLFLNVEFVAWAAILVITAYAMGTLHEMNQARVRELQATYRGLLVVLRQFLARDKDTEGHCYRVSQYALRIGRRLHLRDDQMDDMYAAALLHDIGKLDVSRDLLRKAAQLSKAEHDAVHAHVAYAGSLLEPVSGPLNRILPIILAHHERPDGGGYRGVRGPDIPIEARVIAVADAYDAMTSDRSYRKAMSPFVAKENLVRGSGTQFEPAVVQAFVDAFNAGDLELPPIAL